MASSQPAPSAIPQSSFAGLGRRAAAYVIDATIAFAVLLAAGFAMRWLLVVGVWTRPAGAETIEVWSSLETPAKLAVIIACIVSMGPIYSAFFEASVWQASVGKRLLNIYVTDDAGRRVGLTRSFGRSFAKFMFNFLQISFISVVTILISGRSKLFTTA